MKNIVSKITVLVSYNGHDSVWHFMTVA